MTDGLGLLVLSATTNYSNIYFLGIFPIAVLPRGSNIRFACRFSTSELHSVLIMGGGMGVSMMTDLLEWLLILISIILWGRFVLTSVVVRHQITPQGRWISKVAIMMPALAIVAAVVLISGFDLFGLVCGFIILFLVGILLPIYGVFRLRGNL